MDSALGRKRLYIGFTDPNLLKRKSADDIVLLREESKLRTKVYHVCDPYDIASVKQFDEDMNMSKKSLQDFSREMSTHMLQSSHAATYRHGSNSVVNFIRSEISYEFSSQKLQDEAKSLRNSQMAKAKQDSEQRAKEEEENKKKKKNDFLT